MAARPKEDVSSPKIDRTASAAATVVGVDVYRSNADNLRISALSLRMAARYYVMGRRMRQYKIDL